MTMAKTLKNHERGATLVEFALVAPVFLTLLMAAMEFGYELYMDSVLEGTLTKAARDLSLETASDTSVRAALDADLRDTMRLTHKDVVVSVSREAVSRYSRVTNRSEPFNDANHNNVCDDGETFEDLNDNGDYDADTTLMDWGNADDVVIYNVTVSFSRLFPIGGFLGFSDDTALTSTRMLRIQPFSNRSRPPLLTCGSNL
ncbi:MAG: TadE/TadG family type IV pilus assembly protein [Chakrabartia sp.]